MTSMTPEETLEQVLQRISSHATAWRTAAKRIMEKPVAQRHEADRRLSDQLKALALQAEQIIDWANQQRASSIDPAAVVRNDADGTLFGDRTNQVNNFTGSLDGGFVVRTGDLQSGGHR